MSLNPGTRLGAYEILAALGADGMGEVYRARELASLSASATTADPDYLRIIREYGPRR